MMGGTISVKSKLGEGSEFRVELDLEPIENNVDKQTEGYAFSLDNLAGRRILLIEDNDINAEIAAMILEQNKMTVDHAGNGRIGVDKLLQMGEGYYDAVLMDIQMPVMNGYEATRAIRALDGDYYQKIPVIAMSANAYEEDVRDCLSVGMNAHIAKPFNPDELLIILHNHINSFSG